MKISVSSDHLDLDRVTRRYVQKTIGSLEKYLPRDMRDTAEATVALARVDRPHGNKYEVTATLRLKDATITATDSTLNVLAALDIVCAQLLAQIKDLRYNLS